MSWPILRHNVTVFLRENDVKTARFHVLNGGEYDYKSSGMLCCVGSLK
jgi:hypothetical protein